MVDDYDLVTLDQSRRDGDAACFIKSSITYSFKDSFCIKTESIFVDIYVQTSSTWRLIYIPPNTLYFVKHINDIFTETGVLDKQECYLLRDPNINLLLDEK